MQLSPGEPSQTGESHQGAKSDPRLFGQKEVEELEG